MAESHLYLSMIPETLVASMLPPEEFGRYLAVGTHKRSRGEAMYFSIKPDFRGESFDWSRVERACVPHDDGTPKRTVHLSVYRVLENVPLDALDALYLTTRDGRVLKLNQAPLPQTFGGNRFLYDEICPISPLIASTLNPVEFCKFITNPGRAVSVPRIVFSQLDDETFVAASNEGKELHPLHYIPDRVVECFDELGKTPKQTKTVDRSRRISLGWLNLKSGFFVGDQTGVLYYPMPSVSDLDREHHDWLRSATI